MHTVYVIASDAPFRINRARFRKILEKFAIDGKPVLDLRQAGHRRIPEQLVSLRLQDLTGKSLEKYQGSRLVTDDNIVTEFSPGR